MLTRLARAAATLGLLGSLLLQTPAASASSPPPERPGARAAMSGPQHPILPDQMPASKLVQRGARPAVAGVAPFLTRPYWDRHDVTSIFDHCNPDYTRDGEICEFDGIVARSSYGVDPTFTAGYAMTPGGRDYLYYDGHDGWDIALNYEPLLAAADGTVYYAGWSSYGFGLTVIIDHPNGLSTRYGHMSEIDVKAGDHVYRGQRIGVSGNTGNSTGPHLHFGVYRNDPWNPIDPWGWTASWPDPWPYDLGNLWIGGNPRNPVPTEPQNVTATSVGDTATVRWTQPAFDGASPITGFTVQASPGGTTVSVPGGSNSAIFTGLTYGTTYTFTVTASNQAGSGLSSAPSNPVAITHAPCEAWFPWYDDVSPGMLNDNIHLLNPGTVDVSGYLTVGSRVIPVTVPPGGEVYQAFPPGTIGGPVRVQMSGRVIASQRVQYHSSFSEVTGMAPASQTEAWFPWYDNASPGMQADNVHLVNTGAAAASVTLSLPGASASVTVPPMGEAHYSFPPGTIGGPLHVTSSQPVLASQRVQYLGSFTETPGRPAPPAGATTVWLNWYDSFSPGMRADNIHVVNPGSSEVSVTVSIPGAAPATFTIPSGQQRYFSAPGPAIGGPVKITAGGPVLASQRVQYYDSFSEVAARPAGDAFASSWFNWYDRASPGMVADNIHVVNPGTSPASGKVGLGSRVISFSLAPGAEQHFAFDPGVIGGPVSVTADAPVLASQRVQYYSSFNEGMAAG